MKVTLKQLVESIQGPNGQTGPLPPLFQDKSIPRPTRKRLKRLLGAINPAIEEYEKERIPLCAKYGKLNTATNRWDFLDAEGHLDTKKQEDFNKAHEKILARVVYLPEKMFNEDDFEPRTGVPCPHCGKEVEAKSGSPLPFSAAHLLTLDWLIEDDEWPEDIGQESDEAQAVSDILEAKTANG